MSVIRVKLLLLTCSPSTFLAALKLHLIKLNCELDKVNKGDNDLDELYSFFNEETGVQECCYIQMPYITSTYSEGFVKRSGDGHTFHKSVPLRNEVFSVVFEVA